MMMQVRNHQRDGREFGRDLILGSQGVRDGALNDA